MASIQVNATWANGKTLGEFCKILQERMKYMNETARDSIAACAINVLKGIRTVTKVAKESSIKVKVDADNTLYPSCTTRSAKKILCVRYKGSNERYTGNERLVSTGAAGKMNAFNVYRFEDTLSPKLTKYLIIAPSRQAAKAKAKQIVRSRQIRYAGLARRAVSVLMMKTGTKNVADNVPMRVSQKAKEVTDHREVIAKAADGSGGKYALVLTDNLNYALNAVKGGKAAVDTQMKKAMNKIVSVINQKLKKNGGLLGPNKLEIPFPEVRQRRK